jgi:hypothetical protein
MELGVSLCRDCEGCGTFNAPSQILPAFCESQSHGAPIAGIDG